MGMRAPVTNGHVKRFAKGDTCPVCGGSEDDPRGNGKRCYGFISGEYIHCTRDDHGSGCTFHSGSDTYSHKLRGKCPCGAEHNPAQHINGKAKGKSLGEIDRIYVYHGEDGKARLEVVRLKNPKSFRQRQPNPKRGEKWSLDGIVPVLYHLPFILTADPSRPVFVVEGEKDVENLDVAGRLATCNPMGAGKWRDSYSDTLRGRHVVILPDNDQVGRDHAQQVAQSLHGKAASVRIVELPGLPDKGDVSDFLASGGTVDQIDDLARKASEWTPQATGATPTDEVNEAVDDPHRLGRLFIENRCHHADGPTICFHRDQHYRWRDSAYRPVDLPDLGAELTAEIKAEFDRVNADDIRKWRKRGEVDEKGKPCPMPQARKVHKKLIGDVTGAMAGMTRIDGRLDAPAWLCDSPPFPAEVILPTRNVLVSLPDQAEGRPAILDQTPLFFSTYSLPFDFDATAPPPTAWLNFLGSVWPGDQQSIDTLQEWFGYSLTSDTKHQKILALVGPKRAGKDTIARILRAMAGVENVAGPTLSGLAMNFGLAPLIGKPLAIISDARLSGRTDQAAIVERLLTISGEGTLTVDRKHQAQWTGKLPTRFVVISNELPRLSDSSGALAGRLIILRLTQSFYGKEDLGLFDRLCGDLPGILLWAIAGWKRLRDRGAFVQPDSGRELVEEMEDLASPVGAFVRDQCTIAPGLESETSQLFDAWKKWCGENGKEHPGDASNFGRNLRASFPALRTKTTRRNGCNVRFYVGIQPNSAGAPY